MTKGNICLVVEDGGGMSGHIDLDCTPKPTESDDNRALSEELELAYANGHLAGEMLGRQRERAIIARYLRKLCACRCEPVWVKRGMHSPDCFWKDYQETAEAIERGEHEHG